MIPAYATLEIQTLGLPVEERARLAERLLASLSSQTTDRSEADWLDEVERRAEAHKTNPSRGIPAEVAFRDALEHR